MGGFAGILRSDGPVDRDRLASMGEAVRHRGPDASGTFFERGFGAVQHVRRLAPSNAPATLVTDDVVFLLDGWIYDAFDVPENIVGPAAPMSEHARALLAAWTRWGPRFVEHVEGDFSVVVYERKTGCTHLFRDRFGIRPLFWTQTGDRFAFASTLSALLQLPDVRRTVDPDRLAEYLSFQLVHAPRTLLADVRQVEPGCRLRIEDGKVINRRWWTPRYAPIGAPRPRDADVIDAVTDAVQRAVRRRVPTDQPTGLYLSGGLGSTAIAAASRRLHLNLPTFTLSFADDPHPESPFAGRIARLLGMEHHELVVGSAELARSFDPTLRAMDHPIGHPTALLQGMLAREARKKVSIVLAGDGGPQLFGGQMLDPLANRLRAARIGRRLPRRIRGLLSRVGRGRFDVDPRDLPLQMGIGGGRLFSESQRRLLLADEDWVQPGIRQDVLSAFHSNLDTDPINTALHGFLRSWLGEGALARADRMATMYGVDARFPLLDAEVAQYAMGLPGSVKIRRVGGSLHTRWPLRAILDGVVPAPLVHRPRRGMARPPDDWLERSGRLFFESKWEALRDNRFGLYRPEALDQMRKNLPGNRQMAARFWSLFILDGWLATLD